MQARIFWPISPSSGSAAHCEDCVERREEAYDEYKHASPDCEQQRERLAVHAEPHASLLPDGSRGRRLRGSCGRAGWAWMGLAGSPSLTGLVNGGERAGGAARRLLVEVKWSLPVLLPASG